MGGDGRAEAIHAIHAVEAFFCLGVAVGGAICVLHGSEAAISRGPRSRSARDVAGQSRDSAVSSRVRVASPDQVWVVSLEARATMRDQSVVHETRN
jgi:hypothetical protein